VNSALQVFIVQQCSSGNIGIPRIRPPGSTRSDRALIGILTVQESIGQLFKWFYRQSRPGDRISKICHRPFGTISAEYI